MARRRMIYEGKAKILYEGPEPGTLVQYFKDDTSAGDGAKKDVIEGKGVLNNRLSEYFMNGLNSIGVPTHFIRRLNMREQLVRSLWLGQPARSGRYRRTCAAGERLHVRHDAGGWHQARRFQDRDRPHL